MSSLIFSEKTMKKYSRLSAAAVVIGALRLRYISTASCCSVIFTKGNDFCDFKFAFLDGKAFLNGFYSKEVICSFKNIFPTSVEII